MKRNGPLWGTWRGFGFPVVWFLRTGLWQWRWVSRAVAEGIAGNGGVRGGTGL